MGVLDGDDSDVYQEKWTYDIALTEKRDSDS